MNRLCQCGCGRQVAKPGNRFIRGHSWNRRGKCVSKETREKMSKTRKGRVPWNKGRLHSQETRDKISAAFSKEHYEKVLADLARRGESKYCIDCGAPICWGPRCRSCASVLCTHSEETRQKISVAIIAWHQTSEGRDQMLAWAHAGRVAQDGSPSKLEYCLKEILDTVNPGWIHNSAQEEPIRVCGKEPDFIKDHKIIELFGEYWHDEADRLKRKEIFKQAGYDCLVIWCRELQDSKLLRERLFKFIEV